LFLPQALRLDAAKRENLKLFLPFMRVFPAFPGEFEKNLLFFEIFRN